MAGSAGVLESSPDPQIAHIRQYALPAGGLRGWAITDLRGAHNDAAGSLTTHLAASENRHYRAPSAALPRPAEEAPILSTRRNGRYRQIECSVWGVGSDWTNEVPPVASDIEEYCDTSIILEARFCNELDPGTDHPVIDRIEVFNSEEEANASSYLGSYG